MNKKLFLGVGILWLVIIFGLISMKEFTLHTGEEVLLETRPVDPRDLFRGDYVILSYAISNIDTTEFPLFQEEVSSGDTIYVALRKQGKYFGVVHILSNKPLTGLFIKGTVRRTSGDSLTIDYGIESYFVPEGEGRVIERLDPERLDVLVTVDRFGNAVIKQLFVDGEELQFD